MYARQTTRDPEVEMKTAMRRRLRFRMLLGSVVAAAFVVGVGTNASGVYNGTAVVVGSAK